MSKYASRINWVLPVHLADDIFLEDVDGNGMVALNARSEEAYRFTPTAAFLFKRLLDCGSEEEIVAGVRTLFADVDDAQVMTDLTYLMNEVTLAGIVTVDETDLQ